MKKEKGFLSIFKNEKPILGMLHLKGSVMKMYLNVLKENRYLCERRR